MANVMLQIGFSLERVPAIKVRVFTIDFKLKLILAVDILARILITY